jgi:predicted DCC family thiol-disulfide oxidoreductase YuxK
MSANAPPQADASPPSAAVGWVLYDASCGICSQAVPWLSPTLARLGLATAALQEPWVAARVALPPEELLRDLGLLLADGRLLRGADAYRWILRRRWWTIPLWLLAAMPPTRWLFDLAYRLVARNRHAISHACGIRPRRPV